MPRGESKKRKALPTVGVETAQKIRDEFASGLVELADDVRWLYLAGEAMVNENTWHESLLGHMEKKLTEAEEEREWDEKERADLVALHIQREQQLTEELAVERHKTATLVQQIRYLEAVQAHNYATYHKFIINMNRIS